MVHSEAVADSRFVVRYFRKSRDGRLLGLGNAISDGHLVVYYPHMLVHPEVQGQGIGRLLMNALQAQYAGFHQQMLTADGRAIAFYEGLGFTEVDRVERMAGVAGLPGIAMEKTLTR